METQPPFNRRADSRATVGAILREFADEKGRELQDERARSRPRNGRSAVKVTIMSLACLTVWIGPRFIALTPEPPSEEMLRHGAKTKLFLDALQLREYQAQQGKLPTDLSQAGIDHSAASFTRLSDSTFRLTVAFQEHVLTVTSADDVDSALAGLPLARAR